MDKQSTIPTAILEQNNEAVSLIHDGQFENAIVILVDALRALRSDSGDGESSKDPCTSILSLDVWMASPSEALHHRLPEASTDSFFVYNRGISIPTNFFQDTTSRYCPVDSTAAVASAMFFNQGLASHLSYIQKSSLPSHPTNDISRMDSLQEAIDLYRIAIQSSRHMQNSIALDMTRAVNSKFFLAAINNLAVSDRVRFALIQQQQRQRTNKASTDPRSLPNFNTNKYFESLRNFLSRHRPGTHQYGTKESPDEELWNCYVSNALKGNDMLLPSFCARVG